MSGRNGWAALAFHTVFVAFVCAPIVLVVLISFTPDGYLSFPTHGVSLRWYRALLDNDDFTSAFETSVVLGLEAASLAVLLALPVALVAARRGFPGRGLLLALFQAPLMVPAIVLGIALLRFFTAIGLAGGFAGLLIGHVVIAMPFALRSVLTSVAGLDAALEHAAASLGSRGAETFRRVVMPLLLPGIVSGWLLAFITSFDEVTMSVFVASPRVTTLPVRLFLYIQDNIDPLVAAVSSVLIALAVAALLLIDVLVGLDRLLIGIAPEAEVDASVPRQRGREAP